MSSSINNPRSKQFIQRLIAAVCIGCASLLYLGGMTAVSQFAQPQPWQPPESGSIRPVPPLAQPRPAFLPDYHLPPINDGLAPVVMSVDTKQPVVFLTIDDGVYREPEAAARMRAADVPASLFLVQALAVANPPYFTSLERQTGSAIEDHTITHPQLSRLNFDHQKQEICAAADYETRTFGTRPTLLRPPYGDFNADTRRAAAQCGMRAIILWHAVVNGGVMEYQVGHSLLPGDIVLMHFRLGFKQDLQAFVDASKAAGLHPQLLEDWLR